jgi:hypothetical protein
MNRPSYHKKINDNESYYLKTGTQSIWPGSYEHPGFAAACLNGFFHNFNRATDVFR